MPKRRTPSAASNISKSARGVKLGNSHTDGATYPPPPLFAHLFPPVSQRRSHTLCVEPPTSNFSLFRFFRIACPVQVLYRFCNNEDFIPSSGVVFFEKGGDIGIGKVGGGGRTNASSGWDLCRGGWMMGCCGHS